MNVSIEVQKAYEQAKKARLNAHAKYSKVKVGAAIKVKGSDKIFAGANVEFCVNGISVCAERSAISASVTDVGIPEIEFVVVCSNTEPVLYPCGVCLQALSEFCSPELEIYITTPAKIMAMTKFKDLFTHQYSELPKVLDE
ncbi:MAG: cytidine deaminase [Halobacteriovoraceae bacterium]|jgi:cytidine deaminase|nr:cytidine deaminase [Halobacteriovoraceae bacterium]